MRYALFLLLFGVCIALVRGIAARYGLRHLTYAIRFAETEVTEGETVTFIETICSRKWLPMPWLKVELTTQAPLLFSEAMSAVSGETRFLSSFFLLRPYRQVERRWQVQCTRRGTFTVSRAVLVMSDLFGTVEQSQSVPDAIAALTVLPAQAAPQELPECAQQWMGEVLRKRVWLPDRSAICDVRPFRDGDDGRDICWTASARAPEWMVYQYQGTMQPELIIVLHMASRESDRDTVTPSDVWEYAIRVCNTCITEALQQHIPVRFCANTVLNGQTVHTGVGRTAAHSKALQRKLAALPNTISERFVPFLQRVCVQNTQSAVIVVTACPIPELFRVAAQQPMVTVFSVRAVPKQWQSARVRVLSIPPHHASHSNSST